MEWGGDERRRMAGIYPKPAPGSLALVQGFVNTRNAMRGYDSLEGVGTAREWLVQTGLLEGGVRLDEGSRRRLVEFREALRGLLRADGASGGEDAATLNELAEDALLRVHFDDEGAPGEVPRLLAAGPGSAVGGVAARVLVAVVGAVSGGTWSRLKICRNEDCLWAFYDGSRNRSGSWCTMDVCGSRAKMRAYRQRKSS